MGFGSQKTGWPKPADAPSNLYEPVEYEGGICGIFRTRAKPHSTYQGLAAHSVTASFAVAAPLGLGMAGLNKATFGRVLPSLLALGGLMLAGKGTLAAAYKR